MDSPTKIDRRFLDRLNAELLDSDRSPASVRSYVHDPERLPTCATTSSPAPLPAVDPRARLALQ